MAKIMSIRLVMNHAISIGVDGTNGDSGAYFALEVGIAFTTSQFVPILLESTTAEQG
jgi:hypothetical protein